MSASGFPPSDKSPGGSPRISRIARVPQIHNRHSHEIHGGSPMDVFLCFAQERPANYSHTTCDQRLTRLQTRRICPANSAVLHRKYAVFTSQIRRIYILVCARSRAAPLSTCSPQRGKWHGGRHGKCARVSRHGTGIPLPCLRGAARKACHAPETRRGCAVDAHPLSCFQIDLLRSFISPPLRCAFPRCAPSCR